MGSLCQIKFYIRNLSVLSPILIRYQENPRKAKHDIGTEAQTRPLVFIPLLYLINGINATIWIPQRSTMSTKPGYDSTFIKPGFTVKITFLKMAHNRV